MLNILNIKAITLPDAWFQLIYKCIEVGRQFKIDEGSFKGDKRLEFDYVNIHITKPDIEPLIPQLSEGSTIPNPVEDGYLDRYLPYLMTSQEAEGESYTYGQRITRVQIKNEIDKQFLKDETKNNFLKGDFFNQMDLLIWCYKNKGHRNNQLILQVGQPTDMLLKDPPCLRHIDTRIQDNKLHFFPYFRSWDLYNGLPANLAAIELMKQYCADQIGVDNGEIIASSKGLHLYSYVWDLVQIIGNKTFKEFYDVQNI